jgi:hypothetical protein
VVEEIVQTININIKNLKKMNKICTNPKNYKLTQGKIYEILEEEDGYYLLINDSNKTVRYYSDLFDDVEQAVEEIVPPPPPARTEADVISSLNITYHNNRFTVIYVDLNNQTVNFQTNTIEISITNISCGIHQMYGINNVLSIIENNVNTEDDDLLELKKEIVKRVTSLFINRNIGNARWMLMSTNNDDSFEDYFEVFDSLAQTNLGWEDNPNSGNEIKLWVFNSDNF